MIIGSYEIQSPKSLNTCHSFGKFSVSWKMVSKPIVSKSADIELEKFGNALRKFKGKLDGSVLVNYSYFIELYMHRFGKHNCLINFSCTTEATFLLDTKFPK